MGNAENRLKTQLWIIWQAFRYRISVGERTEREVVDSFHRLFYEARGDRKTWRDVRWMGIPVLKCPFDLWTAQEILFETKPDVIIETGTAQGGSALYLACLCDLLGKGRVITIDVAEDPARPRHERINYVHGSSTAPETVDAVRHLVQPQEKVVVFVDSDHARDHVLKELEVYSPFVTEGSYLVVEDTNVNGHPVRREFGPGPMEAVEAFLRDHRHFLVDRSREKFYLTFNPGGYLRRVS